MFARFDENPAMTLQVIKKTKRYGRMDARMDARTHDNVKTVYPTTNKVCGGYNKGKASQSNMSKNTVDGNCMTKKLLIVVLSTNPAIGEQNYTKE